MMTQIKIIVRVSMMISHWPLLSSQQNDKSFYFQMYRLCYAGLTLILLPCMHCS